MCGNLLRIVNPTKRTVATSGRVKIMRITESLFFVGAINGKFIFFMSNDNFELNILCLF
jgi:hypothetical protein